MAEQKKKKKKAADAGRTATTAKVTNRSKKKKAAKKKANPARDENRKRFSEQYVPYILGGIALFLLVCLVLHFIRPHAAPMDHLMGPVGYGICYFLFGLFGWVAAIIPILLGVLAIRWRKFCAEGSVVVKSVLTAVTLVFISAVLHVFVCSSDGLIYAVDELFVKGAALENGGVIGGLLGWLLYKAVRLPGTIVLTIVLLPLLIMFLVEVTPAYVFTKIKKAVIAAREAKQNAADEDEDDEDDKPARAKPRRPIKEASAEDLYVPERPKHSKSRRSDHVDHADGTVSDDRVDHLARADRATASEKAKRRSTVRVDTETGEIMEDEPPVAPAETSLDQDRAHDAVPPADEPIAPSASATASDDRAPWEDVPEQPTPAQEVEVTAEELYHAPPPRKGRPRNGSMVSPAYDAGVDDEDHTEPVDTMEISLDDDGRDHIVVNILPQDRSALTDSSDYHVNGLADEETVVPSGHTPGEESPEAGKEYTFPPLDLLTRGPDHYEADEAEIIKNTQALRGVLESFHIRVKDIDCSCGPTITRYEVKPDVGIRVRSIANLVDDIALGLAKSGVRIEAPIPGKSAVGIEVPNANPATVALRNLLETPEFIGHKSRIAACLGADVAGRPVIMDINKMPHLLVAGATGSGKSVCINSIIMSIIYKATPDEVKLILIDPKKVEFAVYRDLPHLYAPIVSDPKKAAGCLNSAVNEMERRFELIEEVGVRNLAGYNEVTAGDPERPPMPQMVIIIDELADLMMTASNEVETAICRLAQKARAAGIHLILGTQRPSTDVITGLIKANIPSRIAFTVASQIDSRTIIDSMGAEKLIGRGDMLYAPVGVTKPLRVQGAFVSDGEVEKVITYLKEHNEQVAFDENFMRSIEIEAAKCGNGKKGGGGGDDFAALGGGDGGEDTMFWDAVEVFVDSQRASTSLLQRRFGIGYGKAAKLIDQMEEMGLVGPADGNKPRKMLITKQELMEMRLNGGGSNE